MDARQAIAWISEERLAPFRAIASDPVAAVDLYEWHLDLSAAVFRLVHCFEVLVRVAVDRVLGEGQPQAPLAATWLLDFDVLRPFAVRQAVVAVERLGGDQPVTRAAALAHLSLGFWVGLLAVAYDDLWRRRVADVEGVLGRRP